MKRRAFTLIELSITIALTGIVVGVMATMFGFAASRLSDTYTKSSLYNQVNGVADRIEATIRNADSCSTKDSGTTLVCQMPMSGVDSDGDGHNDTYYPDHVDANGAGLYTVGSYVWFYQASSSGSYGAGSGSVWRGEQTGSGTLTRSALDRAFAYYYLTSMRYPLVNSLSFTVNSTAHTVTFSVTGSTRMGAETSVGATDSNSSRTLTLTRTIMWRN